MKRGKVRSKVMIIISLMLLTSINYAAEKNTSKLENIQTEQQVTSKAASASPEDTLKSNSSIDASDYLKMILGLIFIVGFIFSIAWLIKRMGSLNPGNAHNLKVIAGLNVGQREKIIVLQIMDEQLLVGVTQSNIQLLSKLETPLEPQANANTAGFQEKLQFAIKGFNNKKTTGGDT